MRRSKPSMHSYGFAGLGILLAIPLTAIAVYFRHVPCACGSILFGLGMYVWLHMLTQDDLAHAQRQQRSDDHTRGTR